ncbi:hypothetical protein [Paenibacillus campi]|uniref:hypothetical protein n=1 Tax=Paenibacillus campi TaxID=3106031 RepID=UPI002AFE8061|nr:hypothetical protein [Paenibacillus sp. SGZ-1009]
MNGEFHQMLLITALGNGYLISGTDPSSNELEQTSMVDVSFSAGEGQPPSGWRDWLEQRRLAGYQRLMMVSAAAQGSEWQTSGFAGGGAPSAIVTLGAGGQRLWRPEWKLERQRSQSRWRVLYTGYEYTDSMRAGHEFVTMSDMFVRLGRALWQIGTLAEEIGESFWKQNFFDPAIEMLDDRTPSRKFAFQLPPVYTDDSWRLLNAIYKSWVFGGMGSWNDVPPASAHDHGKGADYDRCSGELYAALLQGARTAVNSVIF